MLARLFDDRQTGFYVDVGAHHPVRFSNTHRFYLRGWRGINIDPRDGFRADFDRERPRDVNLNCGVSDVPGELTYHEFNEPALNSFDAALSAQRDGLRGYRITRRRSIQVRPLRDILDEHLPPGQPITFLTVDVEGHDLQVLESNDWGTFRPEAVVIEINGSLQLDELDTDPACAFLKRFGYRPVSKLIKSVVLADEDLRRRFDN